MMDIAISLHKQLLKQRASGEITENKYKTLGRKAQGVEIVIRALRAEIPSVRLSHD